MYHLALGSQESRHSSRPCSSENRHPISDVRQKFLSTGVDIDVFHKDLFSHFFVTFIVQSLITAGATIEPYMTQFTQLKALYLVELDLNPSALSGP